MGSLYDILLGFDPRSDHVVVYEMALGRSFLPIIRFPLSILIAASIIQSWAKQWAQSQEETVLT
jgi:hypothetical protein